MLRPLLSLGALVLFSAAASTVHAEQLVFTFQGTVLSDLPESGYTPGQAIVATFYFSSPPSTLESSGQGLYMWDDSGVAGPTTYLYSSVTVTGLTGTWITTPQYNTALILGDGSPSADLSMFTSGLQAGNLNLYANGMPVIDILMQGYVDAPFVFSSTLVTTDYFLDYLGTYDVTSMGQGMLSTIHFGGTTKVDLDITSLTISTIPEPSTIFTLLSGSVAWLLWRRRREKQLPTA